jgi:HEAT repeat protein
MNIQELIWQLLRAGDHPHPDLLAAILARGEAAIEPLIAIVSDPEMYWDHRRGQPRWLPEIAMGLLGDLGAEAAIPILIELLDWRNMDERLEQVVATLARIGPAAIEPTKAAVLDRALDWYPRSLAAQSLVAQVYRDPERSQTLLEFLYDLVRDGPIESLDDKIVYTLLAQDLADLEGLDALDVVQAAFERGAIARDYFDWPDAETMCRNTSPALLERYAGDFLADYRDRFGR